MYIPIDRSIPKIHMQTSLPVGKSDLGGLTNLSFSRYRIALLTLRCFFSANEHLMWIFVCAGSLYMYFNPKQTQ